MKKRKRKPEGRRAFLTLLPSFVLQTSIAICAQAPEKRKSKFVRQAILFGNVFQENGFSLRGARVLVTNLDRPKEKKETATDVQGEFAVRVPAGKGRYSIEVSAPGFTPEKKEAEVFGDERVDLTFRLTPEKK